MNKAVSEGFAADNIITLADGRPLMRHGKPVTVSEFTAFTASQQGAILYANSITEEEKNRLKNLRKETWERKTEEEVNAIFNNRQKLSEEEEQERRRKISEAHANMTVDKKKAIVEKILKKKTVETKKAAADKYKVTMANKTVEEMLAIHKKKIETRIKAGKCVEYSGGIYLITKKAKTWVDGLPVVAWMLSNEVNLTANQNWTTDKELRKKIYAYILSRNPTYKTQEFSNDFGKVKKLLSEAQQKAP